jgi:hypothetical protein
VCTRTKIEDDRSARWDVVKELVELQLSAIQATQCRVRGSRSYGKLLGLGRQLKKGDSDEPHEILLDVSESQQRLPKPASAHKEPVKLAAEAYHSL